MLADLVVRDRNPLKIDPATNKDIVVLETIEEGTMACSAAPAALRTR
jgi:predicted amidohydrolase YtcJ